MLLTFAFCVNRGSWTRSWLPSGGQSGPLLARPAYFPSSPCTSKTQSCQLPQPICQPTLYRGKWQRGWAILSLVLPPTMARCPASACPLSNRLDATPFFEMEGEQARGLDDGTRVFRRHPRPRSRTISACLNVHPIFHSSFDRPLTFDLCGCATPGGP